MPIPSATTLPIPATSALRRLGRDLALARRKQGLSTSDMAARLFAGRDTLWRLKRGDPMVAMGTLATAVFVLQLHERLAALAATPNDELGLALDERRQPQRTHRNRTDSRAVHRAMDQLAAMLRDLAVRNGVAK